MPTWKKWCHISSAMLRRPDILASHWAYAGFLISTWRKGSNEAGTHRTWRDDASFFTNIVTPRGPHHPHLPCSQHVLPSPGVRISLSSRTPDHALSSMFASSKRTCFWRWNSKLRRPRSERSVTGHHSNIQQAEHEFYLSCTSCTSLENRPMYWLDFEFLQGTSPCHCEAGAHGTLPSTTVTTVPRSTASAKSLASRHTAAWPNWPNSPLPWLACHSHESHESSEVCNFSNTLTVFFNSGNFETMMNNEGFIASQALPWAYQFHQTPLIYMSVTIFRSGKVTDDSICSLIIL